MNKNIVLKNFTDINLTLEEKDFVFETNFNASKFSFEKEETETVLSKKALLTKLDRRHRSDILIT